MLTFFYDERKCARATFRNLGSSVCIGECQKEINRLGSWITEIA